MYEGYTETKLEWNDLPHYELNSNVEYELELFKEGKVAIYPNKNELFIDIDTQEQQDRFWKALQFLYKNDYMFRFIKVFSKASTTENHFHFIVQLPIEVDNITRVIYQALLGSDNVREIISYMRCQRGDCFPTIFAEKIVEKKELPKEDTRKYWIDKRDYLPCDRTISLDEICKNCGKRYGAHHGNLCNNGVSVFEKSGSVFVAVGTR